MAAAESPAQKDNALWYLLNTSLNFSMDSIIDSIGEYSREWTDSEYFEDFFEQLVTALLAAGRWNEFGRIYKAIDGYASDLTTAQFAYIYGRLIQEGLASGSDEDAQAAFKRACQGGSSVYYKSLAAYRLGLGKDPVEIQKILTAPTAAKESGASTNSRASPASTANPVSSDTTSAAAPDTALENLISRCDGSPLLGFFSYNAGITRVRRADVDLRDHPELEHLAPGDRHFPADRFQQGYRPF